MSENVTVKRINGEILTDPSIKLNKRRTWTKNDWILLLMASLSIVFLAVFAYAPLYGLILAFKKDHETKNILSAIVYGSWGSYGGLEQFRTFLTDPEFGNIMANTLGLNRPASFGRSQGGCSEQTP